MKLSINMLNSSPLRGRACYPLESEIGSEFGHIQDFEPDTYNFGTLPFELSSDDLLSLGKLNDVGWHVWAVATNNFFERRRVSIGFKRKFSQVGVSSFLTETGFHSAEVFFLGNLEAFALVFDQHASPKSDDVAQCEVQSIDLVDASPFKLCKFDRL